MKNLKKRIPQPELDVLDMNRYIKKSHIKAVEKFKEELESFRKETGDDVATLYENANTSFTLADINVTDGELHYTYDGCGEHHVIVRHDREEGYYEDEGMDSIMEYVKFWRSCLRRAKRYWSMDSEKLDRIQDGEEDDQDEDDD